MKLYFASNFDNLTEVFFPSWGTIPPQVYSFSLVLMKNSSSKFIISKSHLTLRVNFAFWPFNFLDNPYNSFLKNCLSFISPSVNLSFEGNSLYFKIILFFCIFSKWILNLIELLLIL